MVLVLLGASGSGKSSIERELIKHHGFKKLVTYTTRAPRDGEIDGEDYHFVDRDKFLRMVEGGLFAEHTEYGEGDLYGSAKSDFYGDENKVTVLTPDGFRAVKEAVQSADIRSAFISCNLGTRILRYINRIGRAKVDLDDTRQLSARIERDNILFEHIYDEVDFSIDNDRGEPIQSVARSVIKGISK